MQPASANPDPNWTEQKIGKHLSLEAAATEASDE
jgi:hypothetical protein